MEPYNSIVRYLFQRSNCIIILNFILKCFLLQNISATDLFSFSVVTLSTCSTRISKANGFSFSFFSLETSSLFGHLFSIFWVPSLSLQFTVFISEAWDQWQLQAVSSTSGEEEMTRKRQVCLSLATVASLWYTCVVYLGVVLPTESQTLLKFFRDTSSVIILSCDYLLVSHGHNGKYRVLS